MLLTPHILSGMMIGSLVPQDYSVIAGFASYCFLELTPHWDPENPNKTFVTIARYIDLVVAFLSFTLISFFKQDDIRYLLGGIAAGVPYLIFTIFAIFEGNSFIGKLSIFRKKVKYTDRSVWGIVVQFALCIIALAVIFQLIKFPTIEVIKQRTIL